MQIAGVNCRVCGRRVVFADEGKFCDQCKTVVHLVCDSNPACGHCGRPFQLFEWPKEDHGREEILPSSMRPARSGAPTFAIFMALVAALLTTAAYFALEFALVNGH